LQQVTDGDWNNLWLEARGPLPIRAYSEKKMVTDQVSLIRDLIKAEETGRALKNSEAKHPTDARSQTATRSHSSLSSAS